MAHYEAIFGTQYSNDEYVNVAIAEVMWHLSPVYMDGPPLDVHVYGADGDQQIGIGVVFETHEDPDRIEDCGAETVEEVVVT